MCVLQDRLRSINSSASLAPLSRTFNVSIQDLLQAFAFYPNPRLVKSLEEVLGKMFGEQDALTTAFSEATVHPETIDRFLS